MNVALFESHDRRRGGRSFRFSHLEDEVRVFAPTEVMPALARVHAAVSRGLHAAGFVTYEAAEGIDPDYTVCRSHEISGGNGNKRILLPLLWFGLYRHRQELDRLETNPATDCPALEWQASISSQAYTEKIEQIRDYIAAGDTYQVNFTYRLRASYSCDPWAYYRTMCAAQKASYCAFLDLGSHCILSASPELFFQWCGDTLTTRPMKGTARRGRYWSEDEAYAAALHESAKNRAENLMIVDLMRNDLARVATIGSVSVPKLFEIERYETVLQMTSTVRATVRPGTTLCDIFHALFPSGSVTGAPKIRTMQIIRELENEPRGIYTGAIGFISPGPDAVFNVAIRTLAVDRNNSLAEFGVGGGIVYDSAPRDEFVECQDKASFLDLRAKDFELLETLLFEPPAGYFLLDRHLDRLKDSARFYGFVFNREAIVSALNQKAALLRQGNRRVRLRLTPSGETILEDAPIPSNSRPSCSVAVIDRAYPVDLENPFLYNKTTYREHYEKVAHAYPPDWHVIMTNRNGKVTESVTANVVAKINRTLYTPPITDGLLPGTFRADLLDRGEIFERSLTPEDLHGAEELFLINSVRRWIPVCLKI